MKKFLKNLSRDQVTIILLLLAVIASNIHIFLNYKKIDALIVKADFYEQLITDLGFDEFVNYPELYLEEGFVEQAKTHSCMWAIDDAIDWSNKYYDCINQYYIDFEINEEE